MTAWISDRLPQLAELDYETASAVVLIRVGGLPFTAQLVLPESLDGDPTTPFWRLLGPDGYDVSQESVNEWCEVPA